MRIEQEKGNKQKIVGKKFCKLIFCEAATKPYCFSFAYCSSHHRLSTHPGSTHASTCRFQDMAAGRCCTCRQTFWFKPVVVVGAGPYGAASSICCHILYHFAVGYDADQTCLNNGSHVRLQIQFVGSEMSTQQKVGISVNDLMVGLLLFSFGG